MSKHDPNAPLVRVAEAAVVGALEISSRPVGETMKSNISALVGYISPNWTVEALELR